MSDAGCSTDPNWLLDAPFQNKKVLVEVVSTLSAWHDGEYNGCIGFVTNVFRTTGDAIVTVEFIDSGREGTREDIPLMYLSPVHPNEVGDHAILLEVVDGEDRGTKVILSQQVEEERPSVPSSSVWDVVKSLDSGVISCEASKMVKIYVK